MQNEQNKSWGFKPLAKHVRKWFGAQKTIIEKPHQINERRSIYEIAKNFVVVKK